MDPITDLIVESIESTANGTLVEFSFIKPSGTIGGYFLYESMDGGINYTYLDARIDSSFQRDSSTSTYDADGRTYYQYTFAPEYDGTEFYCKIAAAAPTREESVLSNSVHFYTIPSKPENVFVEYDGTSATVSWDSISFEDNKNESFTCYYVYQCPAVLLEGSSFDESTQILTNSSFSVGDKIWVVDSSKKSWWYGEVSVAETFDLSTNIIELNSDRSLNYIPSLNNLKVYELGTPEFIGSTGSITYNDVIESFNRNVFYLVTSYGSGSQESNSTGYPAQLTAIENAYPYLRSVGNSSTGLLNNAYWEDIKSCLIDSNYYDKSPYAIPFSQIETYNLRGYIGISGLKVDIYVNNIYHSTVYSDSGGHFDVNLKYNYGQTDIRFQARNVANTIFSRPSATTSIFPKNIYTYFSSLGERYSEIIGHANNIIENISLDTCDYDTFVGKFSPFVGISKFNTETSTGFLELGREGFKAFEYSAYDYSIERILDKFSEIVDEIDHYEIFYNNKLYQTKRSGFSFVTRNPQLTRSNYYYGVSACKSNGEETSVTSLRVDTRWWAIGSTGYVVLQWDSVDGAESYAIYRGESEDTLEFLIETSFNIWVDNGSILPLPSRSPVVLNFTSMEEPANVRCILNIHVTSYLMKMRYYTYMLIILYAENSFKIPEYQITRIRQFCYKYIAPEIKYSIIIANDDSITTYSGGPVL